MPRSRGEVRLGLHMVDEGGGTEFQGEAALVGAVSGVREGSSEGLLVAHRQTHTGVVKGGSGKEGDEEGGGD